MAKETMHMGTYNRYRWNYLPCICIYNLDNIISNDGYGILGINDRKSDILRLALPA